MSLQTALVQPIENLLKKKKFFDVYDCDTTDSPMPVGLYCLPQGILSNQLKDIDSYAGISGTKSTPEYNQYKKIVDLLLNKVVDINGIKVVNLDDNGFILVMLKSIPIFYNFYSIAQQRLYKNSILNCPALKTERKLRTGQKVAIWYLSVLISALTKMIYYAELDQLPTSIVSILQNSGKEIVKFVDEMTNYCIEFNKVFKV